MNKKTEMFLEAVKQENIFLIKRLLADPNVDPAADDNFAIRWAAENGCTEIVKLLLADPRVDPVAENNKPIKWAANWKQIEVVKLLLADPRVRKDLSQEEFEKYEKLIKENLNE